MLPGLLTLDPTTPPALRPVLQPLPALTPAGTRLLDAAAALFTERGVRAVGVDLVAETAGTTKKTLYDRFGSKDALVALHLLRRAHRWRAHVAARLAELGDDPRGAPAALAVFDALASWTGDRRRGCAFVNAHAELGPGGTPGEEGEHPALAVVRAEKAWTRHLFDVLVGDPALGAHLHLLHEGALVVLGAGGDDRAVAEARRCAAEVLAAASRVLPAGDGPPPAG